jgi:TolA-binding protein
VETLEKELAARLGTPLEELRARRAHCPPLEMLRGVTGDALPAERKAEVEQHLRTCSMCRTLAADLQDDELAGPSPAEAQRIRARVEAEVGRKAGAAAAPTQRRGAPGLWAWIVRPALALAVLALLVWVGRIAFQKPEAPAVTQQPPVPAQLPAALRLEMPEVKLRAAAVLVMRGGGDSQQYLKDLAPALDAYRAGNYAAAAQEFSALEPKYPKAVEVFFYGGVSWLQRGANDSAVQSLGHAQTLREPEFADEVAWYLGLAYHRAGNIQAARAQFEKVCAGKSAFSMRACAAAKELGSAAKPPAAR